MNQSFWFTAEVVNFQMQKHFKKTVHVHFFRLLKDKDCTIFKIPSQHFLKELLSIEAKVSYLVCFQFFTHIRVLIKPLGYLILHVYLKNVWVILIRRGSCVDSISAC